MPQPTHTAEVRPTITFVLDEPNEAALEIDRLRKIEVDALRIVVAWRFGIVSKTSLDILVATFDAVSK